MNSDWAMPCLITDRAIDPSNKLRNTSSGLAVPSSINYSRLYCNPMSITSFLMIYHRFRTQLVGVIPNVTYVRNVRPSRMAEIHEVTRAVKKSELHICDKHHSELDL